MSKHYIKQNEERFCQLFFVFQSAILYTEQERR